MATPNPLENASKAASSVSEKTFHIAGILTTVYGLEEVPATCTSISCLWLLHPRLQTKKIMENVASNCIHEWNKQSSSNQTVGLIAVAFDQRNHGSREVIPLANEAWRSGNENHAQDMFSIFHGTATDTSLLIDHLPSYVFNTVDSPPIKQHLVLGISLGGHAAWQILFADPRVTAGVVIIGCPDYLRVMTDRARLSKLPTYTSSNGASFLGSKDFPLALVNSVKKYDPKGLIFGTSSIDASPSESEKKRIREILDQKIRGKRILVCSGGIDKLVPYHCSEPFLQFLKNATSGWYKDGGVYLEDNVYADAGHVFNDEMMKDTVRFVNDTLAGKSGVEVTGQSKI
ncbi:alpha beta hydrolase fold-containing protein [Rutstroemia sp. NJR-2017a BBW]|nr:alpha beta hydrolase fold-containing protein [Rutstroemia sp. NJR-2017a BBW]